MTVLQRSAGIHAEYTRLGKQVSDRLTCTPLGGSVEIKEKLTGKVVPEPIRLFVPSKETAKMITECSIKTKLHVAACSGANATDGTSTMRPWRLDGLALDQLNNPVTSVERIPHNITDDAAAVTEWMDAFVAAAAADDTAVTCTHQRWTKEGGGAFDVAPVDTSGEAAITWQFGEWVLDANTATKQTVNPGDTNMHKTPVLTPTRPHADFVTHDGDSAHADSHIDYILLVVSEASATSVRRFGIHANPDLC